LFGSDFSAKGILNLMIDENDAVAVFRRQMLPKFFVPGLRNLGQCLLRIGVGLQPGLKVAFFLNFRCEIGPRLFFSASDIVEGSRFAVWECGWESSAFALGLTLPGRAWVCGRASACEFPCCAPPAFPCAEFASFAVCCPGLGELSFFPAAWVPGLAGTFGPLEFC
jgi:hypothetical protein